MKVLLVSQEYPPATAGGGIGTYAATLAPALVTLGAEVHVLAVGGVGARSATTVDGVHVHRAPLRWSRRIARVTRLPETAQRVTLASAVAREARRLGIAFDVCEAPDWGAEGAFLRRRPPVLVVRLHSGAWQVFPYAARGRLDAALAIGLERRAVARAGLVTGTPWQLAHAREDLGVDPGRLRALSYPVRAPEPLPAPSGSEVLFLGRLEERKGPATLIRALTELLRRVPAARLTLAGRDTGRRSYRARLERLAGELGVGAHLRFDERWGAAAVREHLRDAAVVACPSRWESFGYSAAEAMAAARPVVASAIPAFRDLIRDHETGRLVAGDDPAVWAQTIADVLADPAGLGAAARVAVLERHAPARVAADTLRVYEEAIAIHG